MTIKYQSITIKFN